MSKETIERKESLLTIKNQPYLNRKIALPDLHFLERR